MTISLQIRACLQVTLVLALLIILSEAFARMFTVSPYFPRIPRILAGLLEFSTNFYFLQDVGKSLFRLLAGYTLAVFLGVTLGIVMSSYPILCRSIQPLLEFLRPLPAPAIIPIAIVWFGIGNEMKIFIVVFICIWPIILSTLDAIKGIDRVLLDVANIFKIRGSARLTKIVLPASLPQLVVGLRVSLSIALIGVLLSEMVGQTDGLGARFIYLQRTFQINKFYAMLVVIACIGYGLNWFFVKLQNRILTRYNIEVGKKI